MQESIKFVAYYRVSTQKQGMSGLGLSAQKQSVEAFVKGRNGLIVEVFTEVESGKRDTRPQLALAMACAREQGAKLLIAKLDRLSRNASFIFTLRDGEVDFVCCDMPEANTLTIGIMAVMAQHEREVISQRVKQALQAKKERIKNGDYRNAQLSPEGKPTFLQPDKDGKYRLGNPQGFSEEIRKKGNEEMKRKAKENPHTRKAKIYISKNMHLSIRQLTRDLNDMGFKSARGKLFASSSVWYLKRGVIHSFEETPSDK
jgi:DNA invertase Pin-like site-specific DNA recombinase